jgi:hypothetical protein
MIATMAKKKTDPGGAGDRHRHTAVGLRLPPELRATVESLAREERRSLAQMCAILVEEGLAARGRRKE